VFTGRIEMGAIKHSKSVPPTKDSNVPKLA